MSSIWDDRWRELDMAIAKEMDAENSRYQYEAQKEEGDTDQTYEEWLAAGNYDPEDWDEYARIKRADRS